MSDTKSSTPTSDASTKVDSDGSLIIDGTKSLRQRALRRAKATATSRDILLFLVAFRILNALSIRTFFQPDEYFQSLEPAWKIAFGEESGAWITWEWRHHLRSAVHPYLFATVYWISGRLSDLLQLTPEYRAELLVTSPKILQSCIAALGDYYTWKLGERVYGQGSLQAWASLALTVCSPWQWFCSTRTLSNCLETTLTVIALESWPWEWSLEPTGDESVTAEGLRRDESEEEDSSLLAKSVGPESHPTYLIDIGRLRRCLLLAAIACVLRPTNLMIWACLACFTFFRTITDEKLVPLKWSNVPLLVTVTRPALLHATKVERLVLVREAMLCGSTILALSITLDRIFYQQWTFPPFEFLYFNIAQSLAVFYGRNDWHYYLSQGYPLLLTTFLPFALIGLYEAFKRHQRSALSAEIKYQLATVALFVPFILSFISHKEVRFIYPLLPILHVIAARPAAACFQPAITPAPPSHSQNWSYYRPSILPLLLLLNILIAIFTTQYHQRGPLSLMSYLRHEHEQHYLTQPPALSHLTQADTSMTVGFLMPCHSTPWRSHLVHSSIKAWALGCEPPVHLSVSDRQAYLDEADQFYENPKSFLEKNLGKPGKSRTLLGGKSPKRGLGLGQWDHTAALDGRQGQKMWPDYLVFFQGLEPVLRDVTKDSGYSPCWRGWSSWFHDDSRRKGDIVVWCIRGNQQIHRPPKRQQQAGKATRIQ